MIEARNKIFFEEESKYFLLSPHLIITLFFIRGLKKATKGMEMF